MKNETIIVFKEIGWYKTELTLDMGINRIDIILRETNIDEIKRKIKAHLYAEDINVDNIEYYCSGELMNRLKERTLLHYKTVYDLFCEADIKIKVLEEQQ